MAQPLSTHSDQHIVRRRGKRAAFCRADLPPRGVPGDPWLESVQAAYAYAAAGRRSGRRIARARALVGVVACVVMALAYAGVAYWIVASLHIGHVVQDGIDTGDMLALPPLTMSFVSVLLATACLHRFEVLGRR